MRPQWTTHRAAALERAKQRLASSRVEGIEWYWPAAETPASARWRPGEAVRLLTPFDPVVWDRCRFEIFWDWRYRFEAYTPAAKRKLGYYALPLLWHERVIGWGNLTIAAARSPFDYAATSAAARPRGMPRIGAWARWGTARASAPSSINRARCEMRRYPNARNRICGNTRLRRAPSPTRRPARSAQSTPSRRTSMARPSKCRLWRATPLLRSRSRSLVCGDR